MRTPVMVATTLLIGAGAATAEEPAGQCGTVLTMEDAAVREEQAQHGAYTLGMRLRYTLDVPLAIHIVRTSGGLFGYDPNDLPTILAEVNDYWSPTGMQFFQTGSVDFIDDDDFYFNINTQAEIDALRQTDPVANAVNVYFTANLAIGATGLCGISSFTWSAVQGIVMKNSCADPGDTSIPHELGHYFDLLHTHETADCVECPDGSNCTTCGDLLCDTPADPTLTTGTVDPFCNYTGAATACDGQPYAPDPRNLMSYSTQTCRDRFSVGQQDLALATLVNLRPELIGEPGLQVTWVDFSAATGGDGSYAEPFNNLNEALAATYAGGTIVFMPGFTAGTFTINQAVTLDAFRGAVTIGQ